MRGEAESEAAIRYETGTLLPAGRYRELRAAVGWDAPACDDQTLDRALARSWNVVARDGRGEIVGIGRLLDDGALYATIWDMIVLPSHQGAGIGRALLERLMERAGARTIVSLVATPLGRPLYESYGFAAESRRSIGMLLRPQSHELRRDGSDRDPDQSD